MEMGLLAAALVSDRRGFKNQHLTLQSIGNNPTQVEFLRASNAVFDPKSKLLHQWVQQPAIAVLLTFDPNTPFRLLPPIDTLTHQHHSLQPQQHAAPLGVGQGGLPCGDVAHFSNFRAHSSGGRTKSTFSSLAIVKKKAMKGGRSSRGWEREREGEITCVYTLFLSRDEAPLAASVIHHDQLTHVYPLLMSRWSSAIAPVTQIAITEATAYLYPTSSFRILSYSQSVPFQEVFAAVAQNKIPLVFPSVALQLLHDALRWEQLERGDCCCRIQDR